MPIAPKKILLTRGQVAWVDAEDFERVNQFKWRAQWYERRKCFVALGKPGLMSRFILSIVDRKILVDHKNHDTLDNQKSNLRIADHRTNGYNRRRNTNNASGHKGVYKHSEARGWQWQIDANGKRYRGYCSSMEEAIAARREAAVMLHGEFACDNS
jgi:hypothetical protein